MGAPLASGSPQVSDTCRLTTEFPGTGAPGASGTSSTSREMRPSTRRSGSASARATSLITTWNSAVPATSAPVVIRTSVAETMSMSTSRPVSWRASSTVGTGSPTPGRRYGARSMTRLCPDLMSETRIGDSDGGGPPVTTKRSSPGSLPSAVTARTPRTSRRASPAAVTTTTPAVGPGAQAVDPLVPRGVEGQPGRVGRVRGPDVAVRGHRDLDGPALRHLDRLVRALQDRPGLAHLHGDGEHRDLPGVRPRRCRW